MECKSGYGLETPTEVTPATCSSDSLQVKMLRVLHQAKPLCPIEVSPTFCGAHSVPKGVTAAEVGQ